jgi:hypothetical protein
MTDELTERDEWKPIFPPEKARQTNPTNTLNSHPIAYFRQPSRGKALRVGSRYNNALAEPL